MFTIEICHSMSSQAYRRKELLESDYDKPMSNNNYFIRGPNKVQLISRSSFERISGYNPDQVRFHFIPDTEELDLAKSRVKVKSGRVFILGEEM